MFLDKKQGWCHIIVTVVPQGATRIVKIKKKKEKSGKCKGLRGKVARLRNVNDSESRKVGALVMVRNAISSDQDNDC